MLVIFSACYGPVSSTPEKDERLSYSQLLDTCIVLSRDSDINNRIMAKNITSAILITIMDSLNDSTETKVSQSDLFEILSKANIVTQTWYEEPGDWNSTIFNQAVQCEDDFFLIDVTVDQIGRCSDITISFPKNACDRFTIGFSNKSGLEDTEDLIDEYFDVSYLMKEDSEGYRYCHLKPDVFELFFNKMYVYFFYDDEEEEIKSSRFNLTSLQQQHKEKFGN